MSGVIRRRAFLAGTAAFGIATAAAIAAESPTQPQIELGDDMFMVRDWRRLQGRSVGVIANQSGDTSDGESIVDAILRQGKIRIKAIYAPEHGFRGDRPAGATVASYVDPQTNLPVYSLYGASRHPSSAMLEGVDVLLFDIQDVGSRAYTYISTMAYAMQSARTYDKEFWVLDRPNPTGGATVEGPVLEPAYESFIGLYPLAMRHGMTVGELATLFNDHFAIGCRLHVVRMNDWHRWMIWPDTGLQWVQTSPNIPTWQTTIVYPGMGLVDTVGINNGTSVGLSNPFFVAGMVGIDGAKLAAYLNARDLTGVRFKPAAWTPTAGFWAGRELTGVELVVYDPHRYLAVRTAVEILVAIRDLFPHAIQVKSISGLDRDWGTDSFRRAFLAGKSAQAILAQWAGSVAAFESLRRRYLLY